MTRCGRTVGVLVGAVLFLVVLSHTPSEAKKPPKPEPPPEREAPVTYAIHWFQGPGGVFSRAKDVNSLGVAVGWSGDGGFVYFLEDEAFYFLDDIAVWPAEWGEGWHFNRGTRITDSGLVAGIIEDDLGTYRVFVGELATADGGPVLQDLALVPFDPAYPDQWPNDVSENGIVTGSLSDGRYSIGFVAAPGYGDLGACVLLPVPNN